MRFIKNIIEVLKKNDGHGSGIDADTLDSKHANQFAELNSEGFVLTNQLPSFVDDVLEYDTLNDFPENGESGKIYLNKENNMIYRWGGTEFVVIPSSLSLGETSQTAYRGDHGKIAYDLSQTAIQGAKIGSTDVEVENKTLLLPSYPENTENDVVQSDWEETNSNSLAFIKNKPLILSDFDCYTKVEVDEKFEIVDGKADKFYESDKIIITNFSDFNNLINSKLIKIKYTPNTEATVNGVLYFENNYQLLTVSDGFTLIKSNTGESKTFNSYEIDLITIPELYPNFSDFNNKLIGYDDDFSFNGIESFEITLKNNEYNLKDVYDEANTKINNVKNNNLAGLTLTVMTQNEYDNLTVKDDNTLYIIVD